MEADAASSGGQRSKSRASFSAVSGDAEAHDAGAHFHSPADEEEGTFAAERWDYYLEVCCRWIFVVALRDAWFYELA